MRPKTFPPDRKRRSQADHTRHITHGIYVDPASKKVEDDYPLYLHEPHPAAKVPPGFAEAPIHRTVPSAG